MRLVTWNVLGLRGYPLDPATYVMHQAPHPAVIAAAADLLAGLEPDAVALQEAPPEPVAVDLAARLGMHAAFLPTRHPPIPPYPFGFPGAILLRRPPARTIDHAARLPAGDPRFTRHWGEIATGDGTALHSIHLCADWGGNLHEPIRLAEVALLPPPGPLGILAGDCNSIPSDPPMAALAAKGWRDVWPLAGEGPGGTCEPRSGAGFRLDQIWTGPGWRPRRAWTIPLARQRLGGVEGWISDHLPVVADLERVQSPQV